jgi:hypothetical protein
MPLLRFFKRLDQHEQDIGLAVGHHIADSTKPLMNRRFRFFLVDWRTKVIINLVCSGLGVALLLNGDARIVAH